MKIKNIKDFDLKQTFECGQCFRWNREEDGSYTGVIRQGILNIKKVNSDIEVSSNILDNLNEIVKKYLDLDTNYSKIKETLCKTDNNMKLATKVGEGIRILNQDPWEMLISFIISAANNIPRISKTIENISRAYGKKIIFNEKEYYLFPTPLELSRAKIEDLRDLNLGFRDKYVYGATKLINEKEVNLDEISKLPLEEAKKELIKIPGVGAKVADCIMLFSMEKKDAFPVDTWIKKVMNELYIDSLNITKINQYAKNKFGDYAGVAQQYLFYYKRSG